MSASEVESRIEWDMQAQRRWGEIMQSHKCMLKFRLPWTEGLTPYLSGQVCVRTCCQISIYRPCW